MGAVWCCASREDKASHDVQCAKTAPAKVAAQVQPNGLTRTRVHSEEPDCHHDICKLRFSAGEQAAGAGLPTEVPAPEAAPRKEKPKFTRAWSRLASGHAAKGATQAMYVPPTRPGEQPAELHKELIESELQIYHKFNELPAYGREPDPVLPFVPAFRGTTKEDGKDYLAMGNLLYGFGHAKVMDVKIGVRTFLEAEADAKKARNDLYKKFLKLYPEKLTDTERAAEAVTKFRYMSVHDEQSTSGQYGFRIDGIAGYATRRATELREEVRKFSTFDEARGAFRTFATAEARGTVLQDVDEPPGRALPLVLEHASTCDLAHAAPLATSLALLEQLKSMRSAFEASAFMRRHECLGTSVLLVADDKGRGGAFWIDFAKTRQLPEGVTIDHRSPWETGNHEDGVLFGLDRLVEVWEGLVEDFHAKTDEEREELLAARASTVSCADEDAAD